MLENVNELRAEMFNSELCVPIDNRHARALINAMVSGVVSSDASTAL